jgi:hypothetical protein
MHVGPRSRRIITTAALLAAGLAGATAVPAASSAVAVPVAGSASPAGNGTTELFHTCKVIGQPVEGYEAVHCADLFRTLNPQGGTLYTAENEVLCQTTGGTLVECAGIHEQPETASTETSDAHPTLVALKGARGVCGVRFDHSACGTRRVVNGAPSLLFSPAGGTCSIWAVTAGDSVVLPHSGVTVNAPNLATPHATEGC